MKRSGLIALFVIAILLSGPTLSAQRRGWWQLSRQRADQRQPQHQRQSQHST